MISEPLNPVHLRTFLAIVEHRSYTRAASALLRTQPAVSRQIQQLEESLGVPLFEMLGRTIHLTDAGRALEPHARRILADLARVAESIRGHGSSVAGRLRIGASTTPGLYLLPPALRRFRRQYPDVDVSYTVASSFSVERGILSNELDIGFVGGHLVAKELHFEAVAVDEIVCIAASMHPLAKRRAIHPERLVKETWITRGAGSATRLLVEGWLKERGVEFRSVIELPGPEDVKVMVRAGAGVAFVSRHAVSGDVGRPRLRRLRPRGLRLRRPILMAWHLDKHLSPAMAAFVEVACSARVDGDARKR